MNSNYQKFKIFLILLFLFSIVTLCSCKGKCKKPDDSNPPEEQEYDISLEKQMICNKEYFIDIDTDDFIVEILDSSIIENPTGKKIVAKKVGTTSIKITAGKTKFEQEIQVVDTMEVKIPKQIVCNTREKLEVTIASIGKVKDYTVEVDDSKIIRYSSEYITAFKLGKTSITIEHGDFKETFEVEVIDSLYLNVPETITNKSTIMIECSNAQNKRMTDAILESSNPEILKVNSLTEVEALGEGKVTLTLSWHDMVVEKDVEVVRGFTFTYDKVLKMGETTNIQIVSTNDETITNFTLKSSNEEVFKILDDSQIQAISPGTTTIEIEIPGFRTQQIEITCASLSLSASDSMVRGGLQSISVNFNPKTFKEDYEVEVIDKDVLEVVSGNRVKALAPGTTKVVVTTASGLTAEFEINVLEKYYTIEFALSDEDLQLLPEAFVEHHKQYAITDLPISLPTLEKEMKSFLGWSINGRGSIDNIEELQFEIPLETNYNVILEVVWGDSRIELYHENVQVIEPSETLKLVTETFMIPNNVDSTKLTWESENENIATVADGIVTGVSDGFTLIKVSLTDKPNINTTIGVTIMSGLNEIDELLAYFMDNAIDTIIAKNIVVTGYQFNYNHRLLGSVTNYLYEPLVINDSYYPIPASNENRPGKIFPKYYITVHDTASSASSANALAHAKYVAGGGGGTSWHYSSGNDGIYHQIPDNENSYHAGDGGREYLLFKTNVLATTPHPDVTISQDGYYEINGTKTEVIAPTDASGNILTTKDINDEGIRVVIKEGYYYLGNTYYNSTYHLISNAGGNNNSIGIETMVNQGSDLYYTWQKTAKLVARLMKDNNLTIDDVKPHHFFSGKNCPETMRNNGLWPNFLTLVTFEYEVLTKYEGYEITFESHDPEYINNLGRVIKQDKYTKTVSYTITVTKNGVSKSITLSTNIPGTIGLKDIN